MFCSACFTALLIQKKVALSNDIDRSAVHVKDVKASEIMNREQKPSWAFEVLRKPQLNEKRRVT